MYNDKKDLRHLFISQSLKTCSDFYQSPNFRIFSYNNKKLHKQNSQFSNYIKTINLDDNAKLFFQSFHKALMHRKLSENQKYIEIENKLCHTSRSKEKKVKENCINKKKYILKNNIRKLFLTNNNEIQKKQKRTKFKLILERNKNLSTHKSININIKSNIFIPYNEKKYRNNNYPDVLFPKISDFIEDLKMVRTVKFINNIKMDQKKYQFSKTEIENEKYDITFDSLTQSIKLLNNYNSSFTSYNKFLISEINKEKKILNDYIINENKIKDQVAFLQKNFDDLILELENLTNFKNLFEAIKYRKKLKNNNISNKTFADLTIEKLKEKLNKNREEVTHMSTKLLSTKRKINNKLINSIKKSKDNDEIIFFDSPKKNNINKRSIKISAKKIEKNVKFELLDNTQIHNSKKKIRKLQTIINTDLENKFKTKPRKVERFYSYQSSPNIKMSNTDILNKNKTTTAKVKFDNYDVQKELNIFTDNILNLIKRFNGNEHFNKYYKLSFEKEGNLFLERNKNLKDNINYLHFCKNYNALLITKLKTLKSQNNDYSLFIFIYHKINEFIVSIQDYKVKISQRILDKILYNYDKNKLFYQYKIEKNRNESLKAILEKELINYIYKMLTLFERLLYELIQGKNNYLTNNYYSERIEEYENKMDNAKKIINNRFKRNEEILRRKIINEDTIKKWHKILFKPFKKVANNYQIKKTVKKRELPNQENENENLLFY